VDFSESSFECAAVVDVAAVSRERVPVLSSRDVQDLEFDYNYAASSVDADSPTINNDSGGSISFHNLRSPGPCSIGFDLLQACLRSVFSIS